MIVSRPVLRAVWLVALLVGGLNAASAQSLGAANVDQVRRDVRSLDQVYAIAPAVIAGQYPLSATQAGTVSQSMSQGAMPISSLASPPIFSDTGDPVIEPLEQPNWIWIGTTAITLATAGFAYLIMRQ